jgi:hypothetical protein
MHPFAYVGLCASNSLEVVLDLTLGKEEEAAMSRLTTGLHWLSGRSLWQVLCLVLFSQLVVAMVPHMFRSLSHLGCSHTLPCSPHRRSVLSPCLTDELAPPLDADKILYLCLNATGILQLLPCSLLCPLNGIKLDLIVEFTVCLREL